MKAGMLVTAAALTAQLGSAQFSFLRRDLALQLHSPYGFAGSPRHMAAGDFDNDGLPDLIAVSAAGFSVFLNTGRGSFAAARETRHEVPGPVLAGDFDSDGRLDLLSAASWKRDGALFLGHGDGTFASPRTLPDLGWPAAAADFNGDGRVDVACIDRGKTSFGIRLGVGDGTFRQPAQTLVGLEPAALATGDFDGDGTPDVAARGGLWFWGAGIWVFLCRGDGTFTPPVDAAAGTLVETRDALFAADFDGDGVADLATEFAVIRGRRGDLFRPFHPPVTYIDDPGKHFAGSTLAAADFDQNGTLDLVAGAFPVSGNELLPVANRISIFSGMGAGAMNAAVDVSTGWGPSTVVTADMDGDGRPDIATLNRTANTITVLLSAGRGEQRLGRAVSAASHTAIVAPGSIATMYADLPGVLTDHATGSPWPERLSGISFDVRDSAGVSRPAALQYVSGTQVNFLVPENTAVGEALLLIIHGSESRQIGTLQVEDAAPAVFLVQPWSMMPLAYDVRVDSEGHHTTNPVFTCEGSAGCEPVPVGPSPSGSTLVFLVTGFRNATVDNVKCAISNQPLDVEFAGPSAIRGTQEIRVRLPSGNFDFWDLPGGIVHLSIHGIAANMTRIAFRYPSPESR